MSRYYNSLYTAREKSRIDIIEIIKNKYIKLIDSGIKAGIRVIFGGILYITRINFVLVFIIGFIFVRRFEKIIKLILYNPTLEYIYIPGNNPSLKNY